MSNLFLRSVDGQEVLYHGTSHDWLERILMEGLKEPVYLSNDYETALLFAQQTACPSYAPVILEVAIPDVSLLRADFNMYDQPIKKLTLKYGVGIDDTLEEAVREGRVLMPQDMFDWETSLAEVGSAWYSEVIAPSGVLAVRIGYCPRPKHKRNQR